MKNLANEKPMDKLHGRSRWIVDNISSESIDGKTVLDIGCGFGWFEYAFMKRASKIYCVEPTEEGMETAKRYLSEQNNVFFVKSSATALPFEDNTFDLVVSWDVIEHIPKRAETKMVKEIQRVLKFGGIAYISTPYRNFLNNWMDPAWLLMGHRHYSERNMQVLFSKTKKLKICSMIKKGRLWSVLNVWNLYIAKWIFRRPPFFRNFFDKREDKEWRKKDGFFTLLVKAQKVKR